MNPLFARAFLYLLLLGTVMHTHAQAFPVPDTAPDTWCAYGLHPESISGGGVGESLFPPNCGNTGGCLERSIRDLNTYDSNAPLSANNRLYSLHVVVHLVRGAQGEFIPVRMIDTVMQQVNLHYAGLIGGPNAYNTGIQFTWNILKHDSYEEAGMDPQTLAPLMNQQTSTAINAYFTRASFAGVLGAEGYASGGYIYVKANTVNVSHLANVAAHELGHILGLMHTFTQWPGNGVPPHAAARAGSPMKCRLPKGTP